MRLSGVLVCGSRVYFGWERTFPGKVVTMAVAVAVAVGVSVALAEVVEVAVGGWGVGGGYEGMGGLKIWGLSLSPPLLSHAPPVFLRHPSRCWGRCGRACAGGRGFR